MDREQEEMQFLGVFGICGEACKIIFSWKKIFTQITLAFLFPLTFIFLAQIEISNILVSRLIFSELFFTQTQDGTPEHKKLLSLVFSELITLLLFKIAYVIILFILSLLYTSAVVYTIACAYTGRDISFRKVMTVVPKVWKRLMVTFFSMFIVMFCYYMVGVTVLSSYGFLSGLDSVFDGVVFFLLAVVFVVGATYMSFIWCLANVVSVLEDVRGFSAMKKSKNLLRGKMLVTFIVLFVLNLLFFAVHFLYERMALSGESLNLGGRIAYGILSFFLLVLLMLFGLVVQTVIYFVCKSYHHENIDKSALSDHLEVYLGDYVPLNAKDVQLGHFDV